MANKFGQKNGQNSVPRYLGGGGGTLVIVDAAPSFYILLVIYILNTRHVKKTSLR